MTTSPKGPATTAPTSVIEYVNSVLDGEDGDKGLLAVAAEQKKRLAAIEQQLQRAASSPEEQAPLYFERRKLSVELASTTDQIDCLRRLQDDESMRDVYCWLESLHCSNDDEFAQRPAALFVHAATIARADYRVLAEKAREAADLRTRIAKAADKLASFLRKLESEPTIQIPELVSTRALIRAAFRSPPPKSPESAEVGSEVEFSEPVLAGPGPFPRDELRAFLEALPPPYELLDQIADHAQREYDRSVESMTDAALKSRQRSGKTDYLRAFMHALTADGAFDNSVALRNAVAAAATVALNLPDTVVTLDDVTKATR